MADGQARGGASRAEKDRLFTIPSEGGGFAHLHDRSARNVVAERLAGLKDLIFAGELRPGEIAEAAYLVPADTLTVPVAEKLGVKSEDDLFGGVVPAPLVGTKAISHGLVSADAAAPDDWRDGVGTLAPDAVLAGYTVFSRSDARTAGVRLLQQGAVRFKPVTAVGGHGQKVARSEEELDRALASFDWTAAAATGVAVEENLERATTYSVGQVHVAGIRMSYFGVQRQTSEEKGERGYGGSSLLCVRGDFIALAELDLPQDAQTAVRQAQAFDAAAAQLYPQFFASRRNYDVAVGNDGGGGIRSGVLEQSWRIGGASGAEVLALEAFKADPGLASIKVGAFEIHGESPPPPPEAAILFRGTDPAIGPLTKYAQVLT